MYCAAPGGMSIVSLPRRKADRRPRRRRLGEKEPDGDGDAFDLSCRLQVQLDDEIAARLEAPLRAVGRGMRRLPRRPAEQLPLRVTRVALHAAVVARLGVARVELA